MKYQRIGVFLSANTDVPAAYTDAARGLGEWIGHTGRTLVYGGMAMGLMEVIGQAAVGAGGHTVGLIPSGAHWQGKQSSAVQMEILCTGLADRKQSFIDESDILVALPGGIGTLDEIFTTLSSAGVGEHAKPVILLNTDHCWDSLIALLDDLRRRGLLRPQFDAYLLTASTLEELIRMIESRA